MEELIIKATHNRQYIPALAEKLVSQHLYIIASWDNPQAKSLKIQDFLRPDGQSFIPIFSDEQQFRQAVAGSGFEQHGVAIDGNLFASLLNGDELLWLNPSSQLAIELWAKDLKAFVSPERLPNQHP